MPRFNNNDDPDTCLTEPVAKPAGRPKSKYPKNPDLYPVVASKVCPKCREARDVVIYTIQDIRKKPPCDKCKSHGTGRKPYVPVHKRPAVEQEVDKQILKRKKERDAILARHDKMTEAYIVELRKTLTQYRRRDNE